MGRQLFSFGRYWSSKIFIPISSAIFAFVKSFAFYNIAVAKKEQDYRNNILYYTPSLALLYSLSCVLSGLFQLIVKIKNTDPLNRVMQIKESEKKSEKDITKSNIEMVKITKKHDTKYYLMILSAGLLSLITFSAFIAFEMLVNRNRGKNEKDDNNNTLVHNHIQLDVKNIQIIFSGILSIFILKTRFEMHQGISIGIIMLGLVIVNIVNILELKKPDNPLIGLGIIANFCLSSLLEVLEKYLMETHFIPPFKLKFLEGIIGLGIIITPAIFAINGIDFESLKGETRTYLSLSVYIVLYFLCELGTNSLNILTNFYYSPTQRSLTDVLTSFLWNIYLSIFIPINNKLIFVPQIIGVVLGYPISFIGTLIYNELIVIHLCGMDKETKNEMLKRSKAEQIDLDSKLFMDNISEDEDSEEISYIAYSNL